MRTGDQNKPLSCAVKIHTELLCETSFFFFYQEGSDEEGESSELEEEDTEEGEEDSEDEDEEEMCLPGMDGKEEVCTKWVSKMTFSAATDPYSQYVWYRKWAVWTLN